MSSVGRFLKSFGYHITGIRRHSSGLCYATEDLEPDSWRQHQLDDDR